MAGPRELIRVVAKSRNAVGRITRAASIDRNAFNPLPARGGLQVTQISRGHTAVRFRKFSPFVSRSAANQNMIAKMIAIAFLFVRLLYDCFKSRLAAASRKYWYCGISSMLCSSEHHVDCICVGPTVPYSFCLSSLSRILDTITIVRSETVVRWHRMKTK